MKAIALSGEEQIGFQKILKSVEFFCKQNPCVVGGAEIVTGAGLIALGIKLGVIDMGSHLVGLDSHQFNAESLIGGGVGGLAGSAAIILGSVGVAASGGAVGIPAGILGIAGSAIGMFTGYSIGDVIHNLTAQVPSFLSFLGLSSLLMVGTALIIDGCRRILGSETLQKAWSFFKNGVLYLVDVSAKVVCYSAKELSEYFSTSTAGGMSAVAGAATGAAIGTSVATSTVTVLGSHALGGLALSLGLVSAPLWPVLACGAGGAALGVGIWKFFSGSEEPVRQLSYNPTKVLPPPRGN